MSNAPEFASCMVINDAMPALFSAHRNLRHQSLTSSRTEGETNEEDHGLYPISHKTMSFSVVAAQLAEKV